MASADRYASSLLAGGVDVRALAEYLGHTDPGFTLRVYCHLMPSSEDRTRRAVDSAFSATDGPIVPTLFRDGGQGQLPQLRSVATQQS